MTAVQSLTMAQKWDYVYGLLGIRDYVYFISSSELQSAFLPIKIVFILFTVFFFIALIYFYINSSYIRYKFIQDTVDFLSWRSYGLEGINKRWKKILKSIEGATEKEYKLAIIEADDFLLKILEDKGYRGETFEELVNSARLKIFPIYNDILSAHNTRDSIVYNPDFKLDPEMAKRTLDNYEKAIKNV